MCERLGEQPVGEPGVARQQRAVQIGADGAADATALAAGLAVVPEAGHDPAERLGTGIEARAAGVVLEPGKRVALPWLELALEQDVSDHPPFARDRLVREEPDPGEFDPVQVEVTATEQLIAPADGENRRSVPGRLLQRIALRGQIAR